MMIAPLLLLIESLAWAAQPPSATRRVMPKRGKIRFAETSAFAVLFAVGFLACASDPAHVVVGWGQFVMGSNDIFVPSRVFSPEALPDQTVVDVACGEKHAVFLTSDGAVYLRLFGGGASMPYTSADRVDFGGAKIQKIAVGARHTLALSAEGELFAWGENDRGQLGDGTQVRRDVPVRVDIGGRKFTTMGAGWKHSLAVNEDGQLYAWGENTFAQLGAEPSTTNVVLVSNHTNLAGVRIVAVGGGAGFSAALSDDGRVFTWGEADLGQTGNTRVFALWVPIPSQVDTNGVLSGKRVVSMAVQAHNTLVLTSDGGMFGWGWNVFGNLGNGTARTANIPVAVDMTGALAGKTISQLSGGWDFAMVLTADGEVFGWGRNMDGELGQGRSSTQHQRPVSLMKSSILAGRVITKLGIGPKSNYMIALTTAVSVLDIVRAPDSLKLDLWGLPQRTYKIHGSSRLEPSSNWGLVRETTLDATGHAELPISAADTDMFWTAELQPAN